MRPNIVIVCVRYVGSGSDASHFFFCARAMYAYLSRNFSVGCFCSRNQDPLPSTPPCHNWLTHRMLFTASREPYTLRKRASKIWDFNFECGTGFLSAPELTDSPTQAHPASYAVGTAFPSREIKRPESEFDHSSRSSAKVKDEYSCSSVLHVSLRKVEMILLIFFSFLCLEFLSVVHVS
jgi:hypothetical protein